MYSLLDLKLAAVEVTPLGVEFCRRFRSTLNDLLSPRGAVAIEEIIVTGCSTPMMEFSLTISGKNWI